MAKHISERLNCILKVLDRTNFCEGQFLFIFLFLLMKFVEMSPKLKNPVTQAKMKPHWEKIMCGVSYTDYKLSREVFYTL